MVALHLGTYFAFQIWQVVPHRIDATQDIFCLQDFGIDVRLKNTVSFSSMGVVHESSDEVGPAIVLRQLHEVTQTAEQSHNGVHSAFVVAASDDKRVLMWSLLDSHHES